MISIEVTTRCNLNCKNCFAHADGSTLNDIDYDKAITILNESRELGSTLLSITGGEPFLWEDTIKLMSYAKSIGFSKFFLNTNGHLLTDELCNSLSTFSNELDISCSVNGYLEDHDAIRGIGSYNKVISGIKTALKFGLNIIVYTVVSRNNLDSLPKFTESLFKEFPNLKSLVFIQLRGIDDDYYSVDGLKLEPKEFIEWVKMVGYLALAGYPVSILENSLSTVVAKKLGLKWLPGSPEISRKGKIVVLQNGTITDNHSSLATLGKYKYGALKDVFASDQYKQLTSKESDKCLNCEFITLCRESGKLRPSEIFHNTGDLSEFYCKKVLSLLV